jgi:hypothetical protein
MCLRQGGPVAARPARLLAPRRLPTEPPRCPVCPRPRPARPEARPVLPAPRAAQRARFANRASPPVCRFLRRFASDPSKPSAIRRGFESLSAHGEESHVVVPARNERHNHAAFGGATSGSSEALGTCDRGCAEQVHPLWRDFRVPGNPGLVPRRQSSSKDSGPLAFSPCAEHGSVGHAPKRADPSPKSGGGV